MAQVRVYINWGISSFFGWGVYGLNLALNWCLDPDIAALGARPIFAKNLALDPLRRRALDGFLQRSAVFQQRLEAFANGEATVDGVVIQAFDEQFLPYPSAHNVALSGRPSIAGTFFETTRLSPQDVARAARFPIVIAGSTWNAEILTAHGLKTVRKVIQGVDPTLFHPGPAYGFLADRFLVFSGGKLERRKGQDIVIAAFRRFVERHPDAILVCAWNNIWDQANSSVEASGLTAPVPVADGRADLAGWASANGIPERSFIDLGYVPNTQMAAVLREMDVALFPNRAEGGTNLVAMECMACGVPAILSRNTGHLDLIEEDNCYPLDQQGAAQQGREAGMDGIAGWGESDVDEAVEALERVYAHRSEARERGARGAASVGRYTWARTAREMKSLVLEAAS